MTYEEKGRGIFGLHGFNVLLDPDGTLWQLSQHPPVEIKDLRIKTIDDAKLIPFQRESLPPTTKRIERPRTNRPQGLGPASKAVTK